MRLGRSGLRLACIVFVGFIARSALAAEIEQFFGSWTGEALAETRSNEGALLSGRDIDVTITPDGEDGFRMTWSTILRRDQEGSVRKTTSYSFQPSDRPGIWRTRGPSDPFRHSGFAWARLLGQTLSVFTLTITADGGYEMHVYDREIDGDRMSLRFARHEDGRVVRLVTGRLSRE